MENWIWFGLLINICGMKYYLIGVRDIFIIG